MNTENMRIAVAGGTGWTGLLVVKALRRRGDTPVVLARSEGVDLTTGAGLAGRLDGVDAVIDVTNVVTQRASTAVRFFGAASTHLLAEAKSAGVGHVVTLSIVGIDRVDLPYYRGKRRQEEVVRGAGVPYTILRATQFHEFAAQMIEQRLPVVPAPKMLSQPVAAAEVAEHLVELAHGEPCGMAPEIAGPEQLRMPDMVRRLAQVWHVRRPVVALGMGRTVGRAMAGGALLPEGPGPRGLQTFDSWLTAHTEQ